MTGNGDDHALSEDKLFRVIQLHAAVSRRKAHELVAAGEVTIDGEAVVDPFAILDPSQTGTVRVRGHPISLAPREHRAYRFHKPKGMLCSHDDPHCGDTVGRVLRADGFLGYNWAGRLDQDAEGLLVVSNDGRLIERLTHPRYEIEKIYRVRLARPPSPKRLAAALDEMRSGIEDQGETLRIVGGKPARGGKTVEVTLAEGKKHEIKRLFGHFDLRIAALKRIAVGPVRLGSLPPGTFARIEGDEAAALARIVVGNTRPPSDCRS
ncbi:MAG: rRNA pseudouridine synthase [Candidatus Bipolaricaulota bacterium]|nr:MAG: rRNA pseudouridine synthase [Candidatus Bipolaricaulota bacterium]